MHDLSVRLLIQRQDSQAAELFEKLTLICFEVLGPNQPVFIEYLDGPLFAPVIEIASGQHCRKVTGLDRSAEAENQIRAALRSLTSAEAPVRARALEQTPAFAQMN